MKTNLTVLHLLKSINLLRLQTKRQRNFKYGHSIPILFAKIHLRSSKTKMAAALLVNLSQDYRNGWNKKHVLMF